MDAYKAIRKELEAKGFSSFIYLENTEEVRELLLYNGVILPFSTYNLHNPTRLDSVIGLDYRLQIVYTSYKDPRRYAITSFEKLQEIFGIKSSTIKQIYDFM